MNTVLDADVGSVIEAQVASYDWPRISNALNTQGWSVIGQLLTPQVCQEIDGLFDEGDHFRKHVVMARHGYGQGEYKYFA